ncbi:MAG TPA: two-component regulator propeller domain-containing protein [Fluviicola sp.]|nr:two-component regulator propeller domain-containing protein [Fluviicola sp.]
MRIAALFLLFTFGLFRLNAQVTPYHYTIRAELSAQLIYCLAQDSYGRLLIGTDEGLYRYNGFKSKHLIPSGSSSKEIIQLMPYEDSFLAANGSGQLFQLKGDKLKVINLSGFRGDIRQLAIVEKELIITGSKYITVFSLPDFKWVSQDIIPYTEPESTVANHVLRYGKSRMAVLNSGELVNIDKGESRNIPNATGKMLVAFGKQLVIVPSFLSEDPVYTYGDGLFRSWGTLLSKGNRNLRVNNAKAIGNQLFVLSENGVFVYSNKISKKPLHWFQGIATTDIFKDKTGNMWIATKGKGLLFIPSGQHEIIYGGTLLSIVAGPNGSFFGGTLDGSIVQFDRRGHELNTYASSINNQEAVFMAYDRFSNQLFSNIGLFSVGNSRAVNKTNEALKGVARLSDGSVYLAKSTGVVYIPKPGKKIPLFGLTDSTKLQLLRSEPAKGLALNEQSQEVAFSTVKGVFRRTGNEPYQEITLNGKSIDAQAITWFKNDLIIATAQHELLLVHNGRVTKRKDLSLNSGELFVLKMIATENFVYILTEKGMYRFNNLDQSIEGLKELTGLDGLVMRDFAVVKDQLFIVTQRGVLFLTWKQSETMNYSLVLSEMTGRKYDHYNYKNDRIQFPFDEKLIVIPFECVDLSGNRQFIIRYAIHTKRERGYWNALPASAEQLNLSHLNPGDYTVEFYLYDPVSQTKSPIQRKQFTVLYEWHNRPYLWWFIGILVAFFIGLTWRWSLQRERKKCAAMNVK